MGPPLEVGSSIKVLAVCARRVQQVSILWVQAVRSGHHLLGSSRGCCVRSPCMVATMLSCWGSGSLLCCQRGSCMNNVTSRLQGQVTSFQGLKLLQVRT